MSVKKLAAFLFLTVCASLPASAQTYDVSKFVGANYTANPNQNQDFVFVKRLRFVKDDNGKIKLSATLSGFPDDIPLGESTTESYTARNASVYRSYIANFSTGKLKVLMVVNTSANSAQGINITSYMKNTDGSRPDVYFETPLQREPDNQSK